ncbi:Multiple epidermal growth factor-like domains protein 6, partial [Araneus ventricosus]
MAVTSRELIPLNRGRTLRHLKLINLRIREGSSSIVKDATCPAGKYGENCQQECQCENGAACDHISGACTCGPGWRGTFCQTPCPAGFHGIECNQSCDCGHGISCHPETGVCHCPKGKHGDKCLK